MLLVSSGVLYIIPKYWLESAEKGNATYVLCMDHHILYLSKLVPVYYWFLVNVRPDKDLLTQVLGRYRWRKK